MISVPCTSGGRNGNGGALRSTVQTFVSSPSFFTYFAELLQRLRGFLDRIDDHSAQNFGPYRVKFELKSADDTKVAATAANRPKEIGVLFLVGPYQAPIGRDHIGGKQIVDGHPVLSGQPSESAPKRESCNARGRIDAHRGSQSKRLAFMVEITERRSRLDMGHCRNRVDRYRRAWSIGQ